LENSQVSLRQLTIVNKPC